LGGGNYAHLFMLEFKVSLYLHKGFLLGYKHNPFARKIREKREDLIIRNNLIQFSRNKQFYSFFKGIND